VVMANVSDAQAAEVDHVVIAREATVAVTLVRARKAVLLASLLLASEVASAVVVVLLRLRGYWMNMETSQKLQQ